MNCIRYCIDGDSGMVYSRRGRLVAVPILQWHDMRPENNFTPVYRLEAVPTRELYDCWRFLRWTRKIPVALKNRHRRFWGMSPLEDRFSQLILPLDLP